MKIAFLLIILVLFFSSHSQSTVSLSIGAPTGEVAPLAIKGVNHGIIMQIVGFEEEIAKLKFSSLRFPPGNIADDNPLDKTLIDAFKGHWILLDKLPVLLIPNLFEGTPEEAVSAARYFRELEIPIVAWEIGNEPDLYAYNRGDPSWTPEKYCERLRAFAEALKAEDPEYLMAGPGTSGAAQGSAPEAYLKEVLHLCGDAIDILTWHIYPTDGTLSDEEALSTYPVVTETIERYTAWLKDPEINPLGYEKDTAIGITEFGLSWKTDNFRHLFDMVATLWLADALGQMATEGLDLGYYFALKDTGGHGLIDVIGLNRPTYYVFEMLAGFTGQVLDVQGATPDLHAYTVKSEDDIQILLVNISQEDTSVDITAAENNLSEFTLTTLSDSTYAKYYDFESDIGYEVSTQAANEPVSVPARSIVFVVAPCAE